jgi:methionine synthase II (cobalamin-independent)
LGLIGPLPSGVGSLPGTDPVEAARVVAGELLELPHLPELPDRGPGGDLIGRTAAALVDLHVERTPSGWRLAARGGVDERRAVRWFADDVEALAEALSGRSGPVILPVAGPWTLSAALARPRGGPVLTDPGAVRDVVDSLVETVPALAGQLGRVVDGPVVVQLDEPWLPAVLAGSVPTESGLGRLGPVDVAWARDTLARVVTAARSTAGAVTVHCCAAHPPLPLIVGAGVDGISIDLTQIVSADVLLDETAAEQVAEAVEAGRLLLAGVVPTEGPYDGAAAAARVRTLWQAVGLPSDRLRSVIVTPACGLGGRSWPAALACYRACREASRRLRDVAEEGQV